MGARKAKFGIDDAEKLFVGYTNGDLWNGWVCPYFTLEVAKEICEYYKTVYDAKFYYDEENDVFIEPASEEDEEYSDQIIGSPSIVTTVDGELKLYDLGSWNWIWDEYSIHERKWVLERERIARILYNMALDIDYADHVEYAEVETECIKNGLNTLVENRCEALLCALENIALKHEDMEFWLEERKVHEEKIEKSAE